MQIDCTTPIHFYPVKNNIMNLQILLPLITFFFGALVAWMLCRLTIKKGYTSRKELEQVRDQLQQSETRNAVLENNLSFSKDEASRLTIQVEEKSGEVSKLGANLAERTSERNRLENDVKELKDDILKHKDENIRLGLELTDANKEISNLYAELKFQKEKLATQLQDVEKLGKKFEATFDVLANNILEEKTKRFTQQQETNMKVILGPLEKEIQTFKQDIVSKQQQESQERISLREQVKHMTELNQTLSDQANKLTQTLRLQVKQQGDWGESILESILENSGLQKGLQYITQHSTSNDEGKTIRPDVLIKYPDGRSLVIDSKVSLVHYYNLCSAQGEEEQKVWVSQLVQSLRSHVDGLATKCYQDVAQALDFVIMFVPVESAYIAAMHGDGELWQYAYKKRILLISPANLIATLKLVKDMWQKDAISKNAQEIAEKAGKLYDKLVSFVESFEKVGSQIVKASNTWEEASKHLIEGRGNLISRAEQMKRLHIKSTKSLSPKVVEEALLEDGVNLLEAEEELPTLEG